MGTPTDLEARLLRALEKAEAKGESAPAAPMALTVNSNQSSSDLVTKVALLEVRVEALEDRHEKTENKSYSDLQEELKRYKDSSSHWTRYVITAVVTLLTGGFFLWLGKLLGKG